MLVSPIIRINIYRYLAEIYDLQYDTYYSKDTWQATYDVRVMEFFE